MGDRLKNKTALISAAGQGIGLATAQAFLREGATVWATDLDAAKLEALGGGANCRALDVRDDDAVRAIAAETGAVDILFNCAGYVAAGTILDCERDDWDFSFDLNVTGMYRMLQSYLPLMLAAGGGSVINMASVASNVMGVPNRAAYSASKAAVIGLTKSVAIDYVKQGIRCNAVCPGTVDTPSLDERLAAMPDPELARRQFTDRQPMGRVAQPTEIAELCVYLASDESAYVTGQEMVIDGGFSL